MMMRLTYDEETDAAYLYFEYPIGERQVTETREVQENILFDFDEKKKLLGVEILGASKILSRKALLEAKQS
jgi:uncharacterized protein YuzE